MTEPGHARVPAAAGVAAQADGLTKLGKDYTALHRGACEAIEETHRAEGAVLAAKNAQ